MCAKTKKRSRGLLWVSLILLAFALFCAYKIFGPNTGSLSKGEYLYIRTGATYNEVKDQLEQEGFISGIYSFNMLAKQASYPERVRAGKYRITQGMSNYAIVRMLRSGRQTPVKLVINKLRTKKELISMLSNNLEADSNTLKTLLADNKYLAGYGLDANTVLCAIIPDTYEFYWNTNADKAFKKLAKYYTIYWNESRKQKAKDLDITPIQANIIASIVEEETNMNDEKGNVASVYLNRYRKGMKLQADPTVKFAIGDFAIRRVTGIHLQANSPYNTYMYSGLPPGPICTPSKKTMQAVLNMPRTNYIYFCAKEDFSGYHRFASSYNEHMKNARLYQQALNTKGIH